MLSDSKLVAFIATANPENARAFYKETLGLAEIENTPYAIVFDANGTTVRIQIVDKVQTPPYTVLGWEVDEITSIVQNLTSKGVSFERFSSLPQDDHGIWTSPDGAKVAWFQDPDGNRLSLTQIL